MFFDAILPRIQIHCWGGLGSQLYAVVLRLELQARYPTRKFEIVCHDNGVTQRKSEISEFFPGSVISLQDYINSDEFEGEEFSSGVNSVSIDLRKSLIRLLKGLSIVLDGDKTPGLPKIRFWTLQVRGHYSERKLDESALIQLRTFLSIAANTSHPRKSDNEKILLHYRLGDLLILQGKSPIPVNRLIPVVKNLQSSLVSGIKLFSDSPKQAVELLAPCGIHVSVAEKLNAMDTLWELINGEHFIGTNSKISVWAVILNKNISSRVESYLPYELQHHVIANVGNLKNLSYY
jgi:hypothetical protein